MREWIVVANSARAKVFTRDDEGQLMWLHGLINPLGREHERAFHTDRPGLGRGAYAFGTARHSFTAHKSAMAQSKEVFAHQLAMHLRRAWHDHRYTCLTILSEPHFFGLLGKELGSDYRVMAPLHIAKDLNPGTTDQLRQALVAKAPRPETQFRT